jgi:hypothetical protein
MYSNYKIELLSSNISTSEINTITWEVSSKECTNKLTGKATQIFAQRNTIVEEIMPTTIGILAMYFLFLSFFHQKTKE